MSQDPAEPGQDEDGYGHLVVERSGGFGGLRLVWDVDLDAGTAREEIAPQVARLPWREAGAQAQRSAGSGADRFVYALESRYGRVRFGESELHGEWRQVIERVRGTVEPQRRPPG